MISSYSYNLYTFYICEDKSLQGLPNGQRQEVLTSTGHETSDKRRINKLKNMSREEVKSMRSVPFKESLHAQLGIV